MWPSSVLAKREIRVGTTDRKGEGLHVPFKSSSRKAITVAASPATKLRFANAAVLSCPENKSAKIAYVHLNQTCEYSWGGTMRANLGRALPSEPPEPVKYVEGPNILPLPKLFVAEARVGRDVIGGAR